MLSELDRSERMRLMKFICSFAWADLEIRPQERKFVSGLVGRLELDEDDRHRVEEWLKLPPAPESVDPTAIPPAHRRVFLEAIEGVIVSDGETAPEELENLALMKDLLV
jgi:hypothetical protein